MGEIVEQKKYTTALSEWTNTITDLVVRDYETCGVPLDDYSKKCAMAAMTNIYELVKSSGKDVSNIDNSNLREIVDQCSSLKLNASSMPKECYFQLRNKCIDKKANKWITVVEMQIEGDGYDALLKNFGVGVDMVYPVWVVKEGDEYTEPTYRGIEVEPPIWKPKGLSEKAVRVVYPVKMKDGSVQYLISERSSVKNNLAAHIKQNLINETFGICEDRFEATPTQKAQIKAKKDEILKLVYACATVDEILEIDTVKPFVSGAWLDTPEAMIVRKMRNNAIRKHPKDYNNALAQRSMVQIDETYKEVQEDIEVNANQTEFAPDDEVEIVEGVVENAPFEA